MTDERYVGWDAARYHEVSNPQWQWGLRALDRLEPMTGERILDVGCGTGRLTSEIQKRQGGAVTIGIDRSVAMLRTARQHFASTVTFAQADGTALPFGSVFDAVFSTATFHWIKNHDRLFSEIHRILKPGGRLVSQCGGGPNLQRLYRRAKALRESPRFRDYFGSFTDPLNFQTVEATTARLESSGFTRIHVTLEPAQTPFPSIEAFQQFVTTVCLRHDLEHLPEALRPSFAHELSVAAAGDDPPLTLDYWRLNIDAYKR
ncbi:class I SAM-dependent methyltransferase [soil metagenome]